MSGVARYLKSLYKEGKATENTINNAFSRDWITEEEKNQILSVQ